MTENDNTPQPLAEIPIGPSAFEQFLDRNQKTLIIVALFVILAGAAVIVQRSMKEDAESRAAAALVLAYDETTGKYDLPGLEKVVLEHKGTPAAETAEYLYAQGLWDEGKTEESVQALEEFLNKYPKSLLRDKALVVLAVRFHQSKENEKAMENYQRVVDTGNPVYAPLALMNMGDIARSEGEEEKARSYYDQVMERYPDSSFAANRLNAYGQSTPSAVSQRIDLLGVKDPEMRAPAPGSLIAPEPGGLDTRIISPQEEGLLPAN